MDTLKAIKEKYQLLGGILDERGRRIWAAVEALSHPHWGITLVAKATGLYRTTIHAGSKDLEEGQSVARSTGRVRQHGAGRKPLTHHARTLRKRWMPWWSHRAWETVSLLRWTCKAHGVWHNSFSDRGTTLEIVRSQTALNQRMVFAQI